MSRTTYEPWSSLRNSDGTPLIYHFDWYDDHSSWRLEELENFIVQALELLQKTGVTVTEVNNLEDLKPIVTNLRHLHRNDQVDDASVRKALELADELALPDDISSYDASDAYDCTIQTVLEALGSWDEAHRWSHDTVDWNVTAVDALERIRASRNGLSDRWTVTIEDGRVALPAGEDIIGMQPDNTTLALFDAVTALNYDEETYPKLADILIKLHADQTNRIIPFADMLERADIRPDHELLQRIVELTASHPEHNLDNICEVIEALAGEWHGSYVDLVDAATALQL
jgi:hypothetical protein